jgi:hypothetical protein
MVETYGIVICLDNHNPGMKASPQPVQKKATDALPAVLCTNRHALDG